MAAEGGAMLEGLTLPIVLAIVFTAGAYAIHRAERHAERITAILSFALVTFAVLFGISLADHFGRSEPGSTWRAIAASAQAGQELGD